MNAFHRDERSDEVVALLETWIQQIKPLKSRSALTFALARHWMHTGETARARQSFEQILAWNAPEWEVTQAQGHLYEIDHLNIGQAAPSFALHDVDRRRAFHLAPDL